jgi:putative methionine-R-sulfoxide reductase with GAF domain
MLFRNRIIIGFYNGNLSEIIVAIFSILLKIAEFDLDFDHFDRFDKIIGQV